MAPAGIFQIHDEGFQKFPLHAVEPPNLLGSLAFRQAFLSRIVKLILPPTRKIKGTFLIGHDRCHHG